MSEQTNFEEQREYVRNLGFSSISEFRSFCQKKDKPKWLPSNPQKVFKDKGWISFNDWIGKPVKTEFISYELAREYATKLGFNSSKEWYIWAKTKGNRPRDIPYCPRTYYPQDWVDWEHFLDHKSTITRKKWRNYELAKQFVTNLGLASQKDWRAYASSPERPNDIPSDPRYAYGEEFTGYGDWLGTGIVATKEKPFKDFKVARKYVQTLGLKSREQWVKWNKIGKRPSDIPFKPDKTYRDSGWQGWADFLGNKKKPPHF
jgi:hypothetical protein